MKRLLLALALFVLAAPAMAQNSPCFWSGQLVKCFPTTGIYLDNSRTLRLGTNDTTHYVELKAANGVGTSYTETFPAAVGATGNMFYNSNGSGQLANLAVGTSSQVLVGGTIPAWGAVPAAALPAITQSTAGVDASSGQRLGTNTNDSASAGNIGEVLSQTRLRSAAVTLSSGATANLTATKLTLTAGDWDIRAAVGVKVGAGSTSYTQFNFAISKTSATLPAVDTIAVPTAGEVWWIFSQVAGAPNGDMVFPFPSYRVSLSASTDFYVITDVTFTSTAPTAYGWIEARRVR